MRRISIEFVSHAFVVTFSVPTTGESYTHSSERDEFWTFLSNLTENNSSILRYSTRVNCRRKIFGKTKRPAYYWDIRILGDYWNCFGYTPRRVYHHTISATLVYGLRTALMQLAEEGLLASWAKHAATGARFRKGLQDLGLQSYIEAPRYQLSTVISIKLPSAIDGDILIARAMKK